MASPSKHIVKHTCSLTFKLPGPDEKLVKKGMDRYADWLIRQQQMLANTEGYEGQKPPEKCKHTREQMVHTFPALVSFFPITLVKKKKRYTNSQNTPSLLFSLHLLFLPSFSSIYSSPLPPPINPLHQSIDRERHSVTYQRGKKQPVTHHIKKMRQPGEFLLNNPTMGGNNAKNLQGYPPCLKPLSALKPLTNLLDLVIESHHKGRVLIVKTFCDPVRVECFVNAVEDADGNVDRLAVFNVSAVVPPEFLLPRGVIFAIKEPYYRRANDGGVLIRVDHPTDIVVLSPTNPLVYPAWREPELPMVAADRVEQAEDALDVGKWHDAEAFFTDALKLLDEADDADKNKNKEDAAENERFRRAAHRNRSYARLKLRLWEIAADDALKGVIPGNVKGMSTVSRLDNYHAYFRAARANYELGNFAEAKKYWQLSGTFEVKVAAGDNNKKKDEDDDEPKFVISEEIARTNKRLDEQKNGAYDFEAMSKSVTAENRTLDHASFLRNVKIGDAGHRGRGLFTTKNIQAGELVMVEKALFNIWPPQFHAPTVPSKTDNAATAAAAEGSKKKKDVSPFQVTPDANDRQERVYGIWKVIRGNPRLAASFLDLYGGDDDRYHFKGKKVMEKDIDGQMVFDMFQLRAIMEYNMVCCPDIKSSQHSEYIPQEEAQPSKSTTMNGNAKTNNNAQPQQQQASSGSRGIWLYGSYLNHSCLPNAYRSFTGNMMQVRATRNIKKGEEVLVAYVDPTWPFDKRYKSLTALGLAAGCDCALCKVEGAQPAEVLEKRKRAQREVSRFIEEDRKLTPFMRRPACEVTHKKFLGLSKAVRDTYDDKLYADLPRLECVDMAMWLCETSWTAREMLESAQLLLRDMGIKTSWSKKSKQMNMNRDSGASGVVLEFVLPALLTAAWARQYIKCPYSKRSLLKCKQLAEEIHMTLYGETLKAPLTNFARPYAACK